LVFAGVNVGVFGKGNLNQSGVLFLAEHNADGVVLRLGLNVAVKVVYPSEQPHLLNSSWL
jgi:hypothetical protein